ncbi:MAG: acyltransferase family protein [Eubacteriales bacterium]
MDRQKQRDRRIDILRALSILCIILAHSNPTNLLFNIRNFDVTMMIFLMGASYYISQSNSSVNYFQYVIKRMKRLLIPTWIFLTVFFVLFFLLSLVYNHSFYFSARDILTSYMMTKGIGYVWIMRVFFIISLFAPLIAYLSSKVKKNYVYFSLIFIAYVVYHVLMKFNLAMRPSVIQKITEYYVIECLGYSIVLAIGIRIFSIKKLDLIKFSFFFAILYVILSVYYNFVPIQDFKYPPTIYYFSYGLFVSFILFYLLSDSKIQKILFVKPIKFLSKHSLDIYYAHIFPVYFIQLYGDRSFIFDLHYSIRFIGILSFSIVIVRIQNKVRELIMQKKSTQIYLD